MTQSVSDSQVIPEGQLLRPNDWSIAAAWALCAVAASIGLFLLLVPPSPDGQLTGPYRPVLGLAWIASGMLVVSKVKSGITADKEGIFVRSRISSSHYQWSEINEFEWRPSFFRKALRIHLKDGRCIYAHGFSVRSPDEAKRAKEMVAELNRLAANGSAVG